MADIVDVASVVNCATGRQLQIAFEAIVKANLNIKIDTKNIRNAGVPFRGRATGRQLYDAFAECNRVLGADTVDLSTIQNRMDGSQLKDAFMAINAAIAGGAPAVVVPVTNPAATGTP